MINQIGIKKWMLETGMTMTQIAKEAQVSRSLVSHVIAGRRQHKLVMTLLRGHGCPLEYLAAKQGEDHAA